MIKPTFQFPLTLSGVLSMGKLSNRLLIARIPSCQRFNTICTTPPEKRTYNFILQREVSSERPLHERYDELKMPKFSLVSIKIRPIALLLA